MDGVRSDVWGVTVGYAVRRLSVVTWAGAILGFLVGGVGGRLAMMLLARLNPEATGVTSDDGFVMGQLTLQTLNLVLVTTMLGVLGGGIYFVLRGLMIGPRWFQVLSISAGAAVVVGGVVVHVDGVDFTLDPAWLAVVMFVLIPGVYAGFLTLLAERWLIPNGRFTSSTSWRTYCPLLLWAPIAPALGVLLLGLAGFEGLRRTGGGRAALDLPVWPWLARGTLTVVFTVGLVGLVQDTSALT